MCVAYLNLPCVKCLHISAVLRYAPVNRLTSIMRYGSLLQEMMLTKHAVSNTDLSHSCHLGCLCLARQQLITSYGRFETKP